MTPKFILPLAFVLGTGTAVFAQDTQVDGGTSFNVSTVPFDWDTQTVDAFFSDTDTGALHDEDDITENWADLSTDQQELVRAYCEDTGAEDTGMDSAQQTAPADDLASDTGNAAPGADPGTSEQTDDATDTGTHGAPDADATAPEMVALCEIVDDL